MSSSFFKDIFAVAPIRAECKVDFTLPIAPTTTSTAVASAEEMSQIAISSSATPPTSVAPTNTTPTSNLPAGPPDPRFSYMDISVAGIGSLAPHVTVNGQVRV